MSADKKKSRRRRSRALERERERCIIIYGIETIDPFHDYSRRTTVKASIIFLIYFYPTVRPPTAAQEQPPASPNSPRFSLSLHFLFFFLLFLNSLDTHNILPTRTVKTCPPQTFKIRGPPRSPRRRISPAGIKEKKNKKTNLDVITDETRNRLADYLPPKRERTHSESRRNYSSRV